MVARNANVFPIDVEIVVRSTATVRRGEPGSRRSNESQRGEPPRGSRRWDDRAGRAGVVGPPLAGVPHDAHVPALA
jgi:hypothetical protein